MWNRFRGKSNESKDILPSQSWRNDDERRNSAHRSGSIASFTSNKKASPGADERNPRDINRTSTSYSSTFQGQHPDPGAASPSTASSYATASGEKNVESSMAPSLVSNVGLEDQMPRSGSSRSSRDQGRSRELKDKKRGKAEGSDGRDQNIDRRQKREKRDNRDKGLRRSEKGVKGLDEGVGTSRGPEDFPDLVANSGLSQFPGQYDGAVSVSGSATHEHPAMSSHVQDQFPGQFPSQSSAPYRPPLAASEGGPGLAAEYYGDAGQSVAEQPGNRINTPSLIVGAEPHLQPASAVAAPPPEPSASGAVGAAASFFSGEFEEDEAGSSHGPRPSSTYVTGQIRPNSNHHSSSAPVIPTIGGTAIGSAAGYFSNSHTSSHQQRPDHDLSIGGASSDYSSVPTHKPPSEVQDSYYPSTSLPTKPGKPSSQPSSTPMYAAGLASTTFEQNHHSSNQENLSTSQYSATSMAQRRRNHGPLSALLNFFKDPEGVAQFEEYSRIIGVCRHCFAPGSSPRDAPRKHFYGRRRSNERHGSSTRVDKDNRYYSSDNESRRKNKSWLATGLAGYGLAKVGESLFKEKDDFNDPYGVKIRRFSPDGRDGRARRGRRSKESVEVGITDDGRSDGIVLRDDISNSTKTTTYRTRRHSRTRSRSKDRKASLTEAVISAAPGDAVVPSNSRRQSRSPRGTSVKSKHIGQASSSERRRKTKKKKQDKGFFSFDDGSFSSSSVDSAFIGSRNKHRSSKSSTGKSKDDKKAEAALLGLGAAAAALALNSGRQSHRKKGIKELVGVKESKIHNGHGSAQAHISQKSSKKLDEELWESAAEDDYESTDSDLAYGAPPVRRDSRASLSSESSGTNKWGWRWGSKRNRKGSSPRGKLPEHGSFPPGARAPGAKLTGGALTSPDQRQGSLMTSTSSLPLQQVYPVPTSDPSRFDIGPEEPSFSSNRRAVSSRPEAIPLQHPRPIAPVSAAIYSRQMANDHSYTAPSGVTADSQNSYSHYPGSSDAPHSTHEASKPDSFPRFEQQADDMVRDVRIRRRATSPASYRADSISSSMASRRRTSTKDDSSAVRFDLTEEQEERDRCERRRKRKLDNERREAQERHKNEKKDRALKEDSMEKRGSKTKPKEGAEEPEKSWIGPVAAGVIGAVIGSAAATERSRSEEAREKRRERRRRERELEDEEDAFNKSERRRRQRQSDNQEAANEEHERMPYEMSASSEYVDPQGRSQRKQNKSVWQEAASTKRSSSHENYGAFFRPLELLNKSSDQVKITSANADADIDLEQVPQIVTVEPKRVHDLSDSPTFSFADTEDKVDPSNQSFPWQVPRLRLVEPTPPSTRGSTPILPPEDAGDNAFQEPRKDRSPSKVKWADDQIHEFTIIAPKEDRKESIEPRSGEISGTNPVLSSTSTHDRDLPDNKIPSHNDTRTKSSSASYGEDVEFAATLAASAEDAGFDPSIVIDNPIYRRRDSLPESNESSMPSDFDGDDSWLERKERKRKDQISRHQSQNDGPDGRNDGAIVQHIISQVERPQPQPLDQFPSETFDDEWQTKKETEYTEFEKERNDSESEGKSLETSQIVPEALDSENRDVFESPIEDVRSVVSSKNEAESGRMSRTQSHGDSTGSDAAMSITSNPSTTEASKDSQPKPTVQPKGSIWDRVLGKSAQSLPQENGAKDVTEGANVDGLEEPEKKSEKHKGRDSSCESVDRYDGKEQNNIEVTTAQALSKNPQNLPIKGQGSSLPSKFADAGSVAKYLDHSVDLEQVGGKQPESFLEMRPEPPPPPDTRAQSEEASTPFKTTSLPASPRAESEIQCRRFSDAEISNPAQIMAVLPSSPTAVPFYFRRPGHSSSTARSLSQTSVTSNKSAADLIPKQKTRPRSTEFKSSTEIRPLWLVERHRSHREPTHEEIYPSLPSSHTTSRSSSVHDPEEGEHHHKGDYQSNGIEHAPIEAESAPIKSTDSQFIKSDDVDSQQATPIASSFQGSQIIQDSPSPQAYIGWSPKVTMEENHQQSPCTIKGGNLGAIHGGPAVVALNAVTLKDDSIRQDLSREENEDFERGLDDMNPDTMAQSFPNDTLGQEDDFFPQKVRKTRKTKKTKRKASQLRQETIQPSPAGAAEAKPSKKARDIEPSSLEGIRQLQEQDAQDAVDSWSPSVRPSVKGKKGKKGKGRALVERLPEESELTPSLYELPEDNLATTLSAEGQESDSLTREMSCKQIVDIMTASAQHASKEENKSPTLAEKARSEPRGEKDDKDPKGLIQDDVQLDNLLRDSLQTISVPLYDLQTKTLPADDVPPPGSLPLDDLERNTLTQDEHPRESLPRDDIPQDRFQHSELLQLETQPKIHLQDGSAQVDLLRDGFLKELEPQEESLQCLEQGHASALLSLRVNPASQDSSCTDTSTAISPKLAVSPRATPLPNGDDDHDLLDERLRTSISPSLILFDENEEESTHERTLDSPHAQYQPAVTLRSQGQPQYPQSQAEHDTAECNAAYSETDSKKAKQAKQSFSADENETTEVQYRDGQVPEVVTSETHEEEKSTGLNDEVGIGFLNDKSEAVEDDLVAFTSRGKGKKEKQAKQSLSAENRGTTAVQEGQQSPTHTAASELFEDHEATKLIEESAVDVFQPKTELLKDEWACSGDKTGEQIEKLEPKALYLELDPDERERQSELQSDAIDDLKGLPSSLATTQTSQEVSATLGSGQVGASVVGEPKGAFLSDSLKADGSQQSLENQFSGRDERNLPVSDEPQTTHNGDTPEEADDDRGLPNLETSVAGTDAAQGVQNILAMENNAKSTTNSENKAIVGSTMIEETTNDAPINENELDRDEPKRKKEGKKGKKNEASLWDMPETIEPAEVPDAQAAKNTLLEQGHAAKGKGQEDDLDFDALKKTKKGKKGKKNQVFSLDEPEVIEPGQLPGPPAAMTPPPLEQEPAAIANDEVFSNQSKKDKKGKKSKRKGASKTLNDFQDHDEPNAVPLIVTPDEHKAKDLPVIAMDYQEENKPRVILANVPQDDGKAEDLPAITCDPRNEHEPSVVPIDVLHNEDQSDDRFALVRSSVTSEVRGEIEPKLTPNEAPPNNDTVEDTAADRTPPMRAEGDAKEDVSEPVLPTKLAQDDKKEEAREPSPRQGQHFTPPKVKKDKRRSKKSKKSSAYSLDDGDTPTLGDEQMTGTKVFKKEEPAQEAPSSVDIGENSERTVPEIRLAQEEDFMLPTRKKEKKSKKSGALSVKKDVLPPLNDEAASKTRDLENEPPKQTFSSSVDVVEEAGTFVEGLPERKEHREEIEGKPSEWKSETILVQSNGETARELNEDSESHSCVSTLNTLGDLVMVGSKHKEGMRDEFDSISAHTATPEISHKPTSPVTSPLEQPAAVSEEPTAPHADDIQDKFPAGPVDMDYHISLKPRKKDEKRTKKARQLISAEVEVLQEPRPDCNKSGATEDAGERSIVLNSQHSDSLSKPAMSAQNMEPTGIVPPGILSEEDRGHRGSISAEATSQETHDIQTVIEANQEDSYTNVKKGEKGERTNSEELLIPESEDHQYPADMKQFVQATATDPVQRNGSISDQQPEDDMDTARVIRLHDEDTALGSEKDQDSTLSKPGGVDEAKDEDLLSNVPVQMAEKSERQHDETQRHKPQIEDLPAPVAPGPAQETVKIVPNTKSVTDFEPLESFIKDELTPTSKVEMLDAHEQREYNEEYARELERAVPNTDTPDTAVEVEMLDEQEQREYNAEYAKELERQLSPSQEGERGDASRDEPPIPVFSPLNINSFMERTYDEEHKPLARPPALEDIIEESRSRPGSVQGSPPEQEDEPSPIPVKSTTKGRKGKKGRRQQPVIWEDETATPPLEPNSGHGAVPSIRSSQDPALWSTNATRPLNLEGPLQQHSFEDRTIASPHGDSSTAHTSAVHNDRSGDYFAIQPSRPAEEDLGREDTQEFRRALATGLPYTRKDQSPVRESQSDQDDYPRHDGVIAHIQDEELAPLSTGLLVDPITEAEPVEKEVEDQLDPASITGIQNGIKAEKTSSAREPNPKALGDGDLVNQPYELKIPNADNTLNGRSPSRQRSLQLSSRENEPFSAAEARPISPGESRSIEDVATEVGLGVGALAAESPSKEESKKEGTHGKKAKKAGNWTNLEGETGESENSGDTLNDGKMAVEEQGHRQTPELESAKRAWQHHQATPPRSPSSTNYGVVEDESDVRSLSQSSATPAYRDSAIYVSGSPMISEETSCHRAIRDSGYPDTEASPTIDDKPENLDASPELKRHVATDERAVYVQRQHSPGHKTHEPHASTFRDPLEISVEANSDYDVSISRPRERRERSRRGLGTAYDSDDSADSGFDIQRRRRRQAMAAEPREPSPVSSTTKDRSSALFDSSPFTREEVNVKSQDQDLSRNYVPIGEKPPWSFDLEDLSQQRPQEAWKEDRLNKISEGEPEPTGYGISTDHREATGMSLFGGPRSYEDDVLSPSRSPHSSESRGRRRLNPISEDSADESRLHGKDKRAMSDVGSPESGVKGRRMQSPPVEDDVAGEDASTHDAISRRPWPAFDEGRRRMDERSRSGNSDQLSALSSHHSRLPSVTSGHREDEDRTASAASMRSEKSIHAIIRTPDQVRSASGLSYHSSGTPPLRRVDRSASGDLRGASRKDEAKSRAKSSSSEIDPELDLGVPSSSTYDPVTDKGKSRADMADVYEGWGDVRGQSPMSPTRPPSMRRRQSMQLLDLETRLDQLVSENRLLASQKLTVERALQEQARDHSQERHAYEGAIQEHKTYLTRKDAELNELKKIIEQLREQAAHLTELNEGLASSRGAVEEHEQRYSQLQAEHAHTHEQWRQSTRELENLKDQHTQLSTGMEDIVRHEVTVALEEKNLELRQLHSELENAKLQVRNLQQQLLASRSSNDFVERDEDYFDSRCQSLCQHVQQWVLRFSKFSDMKACYLAREIQDEKVVDRMENAILDGSDVDDYLSDRVKRRDVFMSVVMTMIWEFVFTRYLFGMDREQRQKLKNLEKTLQEVGPMSAVHKWRATTLTLLMKRESFENQRATDTEAVVHEIYDTLATFLPPPSHLVGQIQDSLRKVIDAAVDLSVEMRTQRAEYSMLPPLQPEYDTNGDLARKVYFSALTMNERSGTTSSNEALQEQQAIVRMVLFPLVVKNEDDDEQIVVCPAQVLTAESKGKKTVRVLSAQGGRSEASFAGSDVRMEGGMI